MRKYRGKPVTKTKPLLLPWIAGFILLMAAGVISTRIIQLAQTPIHVQKQQYFQRHVEQILDRMLGRSHYVVNVGVQLADVKRELQRVQYTPKNITERLDQTIRVPDQEVSVPQSTRVVEKEPVAAPTQTMAKTIEAFERLPGLAPRSSKMATGGLPGFPRVKALLSAPAASEPPTERAREAAPVSSLVRGGIAHNNQTYVKQFFNENKETIIYPETSIDHLSVSLLLDQNRLSSLKISTEDVVALIRSTIVFVPDRGDSIKVIAYPFKGWRYWIDLFGRSAFNLGLKYMQQLFSLVLFVGVASFLWVFGQWAWKRRQIRKLNRERSFAAQTIERSARMDFQTQSQLDELILLAQRNPDDFVSAVNRWLTSPEGKQ